MINTVKYMLQDKIGELLPNEIVDIKLKEIIYFVDLLSEKYSDMEEYTTYFNRKIIPEFKNMLVSEIILYIEPSITQKSKVKALRTYKLIELLNNKIKKNINLEKYFNFVDVNKLLKENKEYVDSKKEYEIQSQIKNKSKMKESKTKIKYLESQILSTTLDHIVELYKTDNLTYDFIMDSESKDNLVVRKFINYFIENHANKLQFKINTLEYLDFLTQLLSNEVFLSFYDFVYGDSTMYIDDFIITNELLMYIQRYKTLMETDLKYFVETMSVLRAEKILNTSILKRINVESFETLGLSVRDANDILLFLDIIQISELPPNKKYMEYLKGFFIRQGLEKTHELIVVKGKYLSSIANSVETIFASVLNKMQKKEDRIDILNYILKFYVDGDISEEEYNKILDDYDVINDMVYGSVDNFEILNHYVNKQLSKDINELVHIESLENEGPEILKKMLKNKKHDDVYLQNQVNLYLGQNKKQGKDVIYIAAPKIMKDDRIINIFTLFNTWENRINTIIDKFNVSKDLKSINNNVFNGVISKIFGHYINSLNMYLNKEFNNDYKNLFYYFDNEHLIKVYTGNSFEDLIVFIINELKKSARDSGYTKTNTALLEFIAHKLHRFFYDYNFYNKTVEKDVTLFELVEYDSVAMSSLSNLFDELNEQLMANKLKQIEEVYVPMTTNAKVLEQLFNKHIKTKTYKVIENQNKKHKVLNEDELLFFAINLNKKIFQNFRVQGQTPNKKTDLYYLKYLLDTVANDVKTKYNFNPFKKNISKKEMEKVLSVESHLYSLMKGDIKEQKSVSYTAPAKIFIPNVEISDEVEFKSNEGISVIEQDALVRLLKNEDEIKEQVIAKRKNMIFETLNLLSSVLDITPNKQIVKIVSDMIDKYNHKFAALQYKLTKEVKKNDALKDQSFLVSVEYDIIKTLVILMTIDKLVVSDKIGKYMNSNSLKLLEGEKNDVIKKQVMLLSNKKIGVVDKKVGDKYLVNIANEDLVIVERSAFILTSSFKDKIVRITKGPHKGRYGEVQDIKMSSVIKSTFNASLEKRIQYITDLQNKYKDEITRLLKTKNNIQMLGSIDNVEFNLAMTFRKKELAKLEKLVGDKNNKLSKTEMNYAKQRLQKLKMNLTIKKILFAEELKEIEKHRLETIKMLKISILNIQNELDGYHKRSQGKNVVVKINAGQKNERNMLFSYDEINLNISKVEIEEILKGLSGRRSNIQFENIYQFAQFLFNNLNSTKNIDMRMSLVQYYQMIYVSLIDILNIEKNANVGKLTNEKRLKEKLQKLKEIDAKLKKQILEGSNDKELIIKRKKYSMLIKSLYTRIKNTKNEIKNNNLMSIIIKPDVFEKNKNIIGDFIKMETTYDISYTIFDKNDKVLHKEMKDAKISNDEVAADEANRIQKITDDLIDNAKDYIGDIMKKLEDVNKPTRNIYYSIVNDN